MIDMTEQYINIQDFNKREIQAILNFMDTGEISPLIKNLVPLLMRMSEEDFTILYYSLESRSKLN